MFCFEGKAQINEKCPFLVTVPMLEAMTQAYSLEEAQEMITDYLSLLIDDNKAKALQFNFKWSNRETGDFVILTEDIRFIGIMLKRKRQARGMTLKQSADLLGAKSANSIAAYENNQREPSISKLEKLLNVYNERLSLRSIVS